MWAPGYYSMRLSSIVGPTGKVFAEEIWATALRCLDLRVRLFDLHNMEIIKGEDDHPKLPSGALAAVLVVNAKSINLCASRFCNLLNLGAVW
jgi:hypothetical protein